MSLHTRPGPVQFYSHELRRLAASAHPLPRLSRKYRWGFYGRKLKRVELTPDLYLLLEDVFTPRENKVFRMRHALNEERSHSFEEIGYFFDVTGQRVRQIYQKCWVKLTDPSIRERLLDALDSSPDARLIRNPLMMEAAQHRSTRIGNSA